MFPKERKTIKIKALKDKLQAILGTKYVENEYEMAAIVPYYGDLDGPLITGNNAYDAENRVYTLQVDDFATEGEKKEIQFTDDTLMSGLSFYIVLAEDINKGKDELSTIIQSAQMIEKTNYHTDKDYFNGKAVSSKGFWKDFEVALSKAIKIGQKAFADAKEILAAKEGLSTAIANLIPTSQLNATKLYEALRPLYWISIENQATYEELGERWKVTADNCTQASWTAYMQTREPAEAYLAKLFDKDGNATAFNKAEAAKGDQPGETEADKLADAIDPTQLVNQEKYDTAYQNWKEREAEANSLLQQYDPAKLTKARLYRSFLEDLYRYLSCIERNRGISYHRRY